MFVNLKVVLEQGKAKHTTVITKKGHYIIKKLSDINFDTHIPIRVIFTRYIKPNYVEYYVFNYFKQSYLILDRMVTPATPTELVEYIEELEFQVKNTTGKDLLRFEIDNSFEHISKGSLSDKPFIKSLADNDQVFFNSYLNDIKDIYFL